MSHHTEVHASIYKTSAGKAGRVLPLLLLLYIAASQLSPYVGDVQEHLQRQGQLHSL